MSQNRSRVSNHSTGLISEMLERRVMLAGDLLPPANEAVVNGFAYYDRNASGAYDSGDQAIFSGATAYADLNSNGAFDTGEPSAAVSSGGFALSLETGGTYNIGVQFPAGYTQSEPSTPTVQVEAVAGQRINAGQFGAWTKAGVVANVFEDVNADGVNTSGVDSITFSAQFYADLNNNGVLDTDEPATRASSSNNFTYRLDLKPGTYTFRMAPDAGWKQSTPANNAGITTTLTAGLVQIGGMNFGLYNTGRIIGFAFNDLNKNGTYESGTDATLSGRTIYVDLNDNGALDSGEPSQVTTSGYSFDLYPGTYKIRQVLPAGWTQTAPASNGAITQTVKSGLGTLGNNFGSRVFASTASISAFVFEDADSDGVQDTNDGAAASGLLFYLDADNSGTYNNNEVQARPLNGAMTFTNLLPGTYQIRMFANASRTPTNLPITVTVNEGEQKSVASIGVHTNYTVTGLAFADFDSDGIFDTNETLMSGRTIYVDANKNNDFDNGEPTSVTDSKGAFSFVLGQGNYVLRQMIPSGWKETGRSQSVVVSGSTFSTDGTVRVPTDSANNSLRFGSQSIPLSRVAGFVVRDTNGNGVRDTGEATLTPGDVVYIDANNNSTLDTGETSFTTNVDGWFFYLQPGTYTLRQQLPAGWQQTSPAGNAAFTVNVVAGTQLYGPYYFMRYLPSKGAISGKVFKDIDRDGILDSDEVGATQQNVYIDANNDGVWQASEKYANLDANGNWSFTGLPAGSYTLRLLLNTGWGQTAPANDGAITINLAADETKSGVLFGAADYRPGYVGGYVFNDTNNNGKRDTGETGLSNVIVYWDTERNGKLDSIPSNDTITRTNADGYWSMSLQEYNRYTYRFAFYNQTGRVLTTPALGYYETAPIAGQTVNGYDFGLRVAPVGGSISGTVYSDANSNAKRDSGEAGVDGVTIYNDANNNSKMDVGEKFTTTDSNGLYLLDGLSAGSYKIRQVLTTGWSQTTPANNYGWTITLATNQAQAAKDFGRKQAAPITPGSIAGTIWSDLDHDGVKDAGETLWTQYGLGVYVDLNNNNALDSGEPTADTAETGQYSFTNLQPGTYIVRLNPAMGLLKQTSPASGVGVTAVVSSGAQTNAAAFGVAQTYEVFVAAFNDVNGNAALDGGTDTQIAGRTIYADLNNNSVLDTNEPRVVTTAGSSEMFLFSGTYTLRQVLPAGYRETGRQLTLFVAGTQFVSNGTVRVPTDLQTEAAGAPVFVFLSQANPVASGGSIAGTVWNDLDGDGTKDSNEVGVAGITVYNDANNNSKLDAGEKTTMTDGAGLYTLSNLSAGSYKIRQVLQSGWSQTTPSNNYGWTLTLASNQNLTAKNFGTKQSGVTPPPPPPPTGAKISGTIFNDLNGNGSKNSGEAGVGSNWKVYIDLDNDSILDANEVFTTTDADGNWTLSGLAAGTYKVRQVLQSGWKQTTPTNNYGISVTVASNQSATGKLFGSKKIA